MRKIIILNKTDRGSFFDVSYVLWLTVPVVQQTMRANPNATSSVMNATIDELTAIRSGAVVEEVGVEPYANTTSLATIGTSLVNKFNTKQATLNSVVEFAYFGTYWDGSSWAIQGA